MKAIVKAGRHVDRSLATASWWDEYELVAGEYPVWWTRIGGSQVPPGHPDAYYGLVVVEATLVESYRENRFFSAVTANREQPNRASVVVLRPYRYEMVVGATFYDGLVTLADGDVRPYDDDLKCRACRQHLNDGCADDCRRMFVWRRVQPHDTKPGPHPCPTCHEDALSHRGARDGHRLYACRACGAEHLSRDCCDQCNWCHQPATRHAIGCPRPRDCF